VTNPLASAVAVVVLVGDPEFGVNVLEMVVVTVTSVVPAPVNWLRIPALV
jgi:hypothetical protein